jgi:hypothetical protein
MNDSKYESTGNNEVVTAKLRKKEVPVVHVYVKNDSAMCEF